MGVELLADFVQPGQVLLVRIGRQNGLGRFELPFQGDAFPVQGDDLSQSCPGVRRRSTGPEEPLIQTHRLVFEASQLGFEASLVQMAPQGWPVKAFLQGGDI